MNHPFSLQLEDLEQLEFEIALTDAAIAGSGTDMTTMAVGEEGGGDSCFPSDCFTIPKTPKYPTSSCKPPTYTTKAYGENGGCWTF